MDDYQKYIEDRKFLKWVFDTDPATEKHYTDYLKAHPEEKDDLLLAKKELGLLAVRHREPGPGKKEIIYYKLLRGIQEQDLSFRLRSVRFVRYAAVALLFFSIGFFSVYKFKTEQPMLPVDESLLVKSASLNTMVYLADGSQKEIDDAATMIDFSSPGFLLLGKDSIKMGTITTGPLKNLVVVPYGKRARIKLYDNSIINLNAGSRIILPDQFSSETRNAYLVGEAFFDIEKDTEHPFFVETSSSTIKVLGTTFNICAYPDRNELTTYLQEGLIRFRSSEESWFSGWHDLKPGEQAIFNKKTKSTTIARGDELYYQLWKDGIMQFNNETLQDLLIRVGQYYNITLKVAAEHQADMRRIKGKLDLNTDMSEVFEYIEKITDEKITEINAGEFMLN